MSSVIFDGSHFEDFDGMKTSVHGFYKSLLSESEAWRPKVDNLSLAPLSNYARMGIGLDFLEEVLKAPHECCGDKSPS